MHFTETWTRESPIQCDRGHYRTVIRTCALDRLSAPADPPDRREYEHESDGNERHNGLASVSSSASTIMTGTGTGSAFVRSPASVSYASVIVTLVVVSIASVDDSSPKPHRFRVARLRAFRRTPSAIRSTAVAGPRPWRRRQLPTRCRRSQFEPRRRSPRRRARCRLRESHRKTGTR